MEENESLQFLRMAENRRCPRCGDAELTPAEAGETPLLFCPACRGCLIPRREMVRTMERQARAIRDQIDMDEKDASIPDDGGTIDCAACLGRMEHHGFMGGTQVMIDSCGSCGLVWLDNDERAVMTVMVARAARRERQRSQEFRAREAELTAQMTNIVDGKERIEREIARAGFSKRGLLFGRNVAIATINWDRVFGLENDHWRFNPSDES